MEDWIRNILELNPIWYWGVGLLVSFPLLTIFLNEIGYFVTQKDASLGKPLRAVKNFILPLIVLVVLLTQVFSFENNSLYINILETIIGVLAINAGLNFITRLFFVNGKKGELGANIPQLFLDILRVFLVVLGSAIVLSTVWKVELGGLVTALGLGSFVLGLALQDTLGNLFSGIALVYEKPFEVGDYIKVEENYGMVVEMNWRAVHVLTREKELIVIPHLKVGQNTLLNYSKPTPIHIIKQVIRFSYADAPNLVKKALMETCHGVPGILDTPEPEIKTIDYRESSIAYEVEFGIATFQFHEELTDEFMTRVWYTAQRYHLTIPFPQMSLHYADKVLSNEENSKNELDRELQRLPNYLSLDRSKEGLLESSRILYFAKEEVIIRQGEATGIIYILVHGEIDLLVKGEKGKNIHINTINEGDFFGEVALLSSRRSSMTAVAKTDVKAIELTAEEVGNMVNDNQKLAFQMDEIMDTRRKNITKKLSKEK